MSAIATIAAARALGLSVPGDLSVIGFDNVPESALCDPPLTTIEQPMQADGASEAVRLLIGLIEESDELVTHRGCCRRSSWCAARAAPPGAAS